MDWVPTHPQWSYNIGSSIPFLRTVMAHLVDDGQLGVSGHIDWIKGILLWQLSFLEGSTRKILVYHVNSKGGFFKLETLRRINMITLKGGGYKNIF